MQAGSRAPPSALWGSPFLGSQCSVILIGESLMKEIWHAIDI